MTTRVHNSFLAVFDVLRLGLAGNLLLAVGCAPLLAVLLTTDARLTWPLLAVLAPPCACVVAAALVAYREHAAIGRSLLAAFAGGLRATWRRSLALGVAATALVTVVTVDIGVVAGASYAVVLMPALLMAATLTAGVTVTALVAIAEDPRAKLLDVVRVASYASIRRWYLTAFSLLVLAIQGAIFAQAPAFAIGLTAAPTLYLLWSNGRHALSPVLRPAADALARTN